MKGKYLVILAILSGMLLVYWTNSLAMLADKNNLQDEYKSATIQCDVCHVKGDFKALNNYGKDYNDAGRNTEAVKAIAGKDSDGDGIKNADEIMAGTNPGDPESKPENKPETNQESK